MARGLGSIPQRTQSATAMTHLRRVLVTNKRKTLMLPNVEGPKEIRYCKHLDHKHRCVVWVLWGIIKRGRRGVKWRHLGLVESAQLPGRVACERLSKHTYIHTHTQTSQPNTRTRYTYAQLSHTIQITIYTVAFLKVEDGKKPKQTLFMMIRRSS